MGQRLSRKRHGEIIPDFDTEPRTQHELVRQRSRATFLKHLDQVARIASGEHESVSTTRTTQDGRETVSETRSKPTAKDKLAALEFLAKHGRLDPKVEAQAAGVLGGVSIPELTRALVGALSDPAVRRWLADDPAMADTLRLLSAQPVPASDMPEHGAASDEEARP